MAALYSATERFRKMYAPDGASFAVHVGLYAACNIAYREDDKVGKKPIRLFHGAADDWVPPPPAETTRHASGRRAPTSPSRSSRGPTTPTTPPP